jgi:hypothetical protein
MSNEIKADAERAEQRIEQREYERVTVELEVFLKKMAEGSTPLMPPGQVGLVLIAALTHHAAAVGRSIGLSRSDYDKRVSVMADTAYRPRVAIPRVIV